MIKITIDTKALAAGLQATQRKVDRCAAIALTKTAQHAQKAVIAEMPRVFDRPTPYALRGTRVKPANYKTGRMEASVEFKTDVSKGTPAEKYLHAEVFGGARRLKRFEVALQRIGVLPAGMVVVPGKGIKLDAYGSFVWRRLDGVATFERITQEMREVFGPSIEPAEERLKKFLIFLYRDKFIELFTPATTTPLP